MLGRCRGVARLIGAISTPAAPCLLRLSAFLSTLVAGDPQLAALTATAAAGGPAATAAGGPAATAAVSINYLTDRCGLSPDKALKASKFVSHLTTTSIPDAVLAFLRNAGLSDSEVACTVSAYPAILCSSLDKYLAPNVAALGELGLSQRQIAGLIVATPLALRNRQLAQRVQFWIDLLRSGDMVLQALKCNWHLLTTDVDNLLLPNLTLLFQSGLRIKHLRRPSMTMLLTRKHRILRDLVSRAQDLGIPSTSGLFCEALMTVNGLSKTTLQAKIAAMQSLGWSADQVSMAISKQPRILARSLDTLQPKMEFLVKEFMLDPADIARSPVMLKYSLKSRLVLRHSVLKALREKVLKVWKPVTIITMGEKMFLRDIVLGNEHNIRGLTKAYIAAQVAKSPVDLSKDYDSNNSSFSVRRADLARILRGSH